jgi:DnaK suppressor protein
VKAPVKAAAQAAVKTPAKPTAAPPASRPATAAAAPPKPAPKSVTKPAPRPVAKSHAPAEPDPQTVLVAIGPFRERLMRKREEIVALYRNDLRLGQEATDEPTEDIVDRANNSYSRELSFSISDAERNLLLQIDDAIRRLDAGSFGRCGHCSRAIASLRLEALPWARLCIDCQELFEKGMLAEA